MDDNNNSNNNTKLGSGESKNNNSEQQEENPNLSSNGEQQEGDGEREGGGPQRQTSRRTPFTNLSQVDADLALARTLQEQVSFFFSMFLSFLLKWIGFFSFLGLYGLGVLVVF